MVNEFFEKYQTYREPSLNQRRFKHNHLLKLLDSLPFHKEIIGHSYEKRAIYKVTIGNGPIQVLLWSQMHGNEATATMAIFDVFNFFAASNDGFDEFRKLISEQITLHFVPMLNPDGAEQFIRRTAQQIDMNRDAVALATPESRILKKLQDQIKPAFSFNLHDQHVRYAAGNTANQAAISFLATAFDPDRSWNKNRTEAMQVICELNAWVQEKIPQKVGRFTDEFEPRAFGDNIQKWGSSLILIESGGYGDDLEKQYIRKLNAGLLLKAFKSIAEKSYIKHLLSDYEAIPINDKCLFDLLIRNVLIEVNDNEFIRLDLGINVEEKNLENANEFEFTSSLEDMGDLSVFWGIRELDASGYLAEGVKKYPEIEQKFKSELVWTDAPQFEKNASFVLSKNEMPEILVLNGKLINLT